MLSCSIWFSAPSFWMGGGHESRCVGRVCGADGAPSAPRLIRQYCLIAQYCLIIVLSDKTILSHNTVLSDKTCLIRALCDNSIFDKSIVP